MTNLLKWAGIAAGGLAVILIAMLVFLSARGRSGLTQTFEVEHLLSSAPSDSAAIAAGAHLASIHACRYCHGENLAGEVLIDAPPFRVVASNLTGGAGGVGATFTVADWDRAIRHGVRPDGTPLIPVMPSASAFHNLSDRDAENLIAYLSQLPPIDADLPPSRLKLMGQVLAGLGALDLAGEVDVSPPRAQSPEVGPTPEYGAYLATITCSACHGDDFRGGPALDPESPPAPGLTTVGAWPPDDFARALREGIAPDGRQYHEVMPYGAFAHMTDDEITALQLYLGTLMGGEAGTVDTG